MAIRPGNAFDTLNAGVEVWTQVCKFDIGATGAHTIKFGRGMSVARTAAGAYTITFSDVGGHLLGLQCFHMSAANTGPLNLKEVRDSQSLTAKTVQYEAFSVGTTPTRTEIPNGDDVMIVAYWLKTQ